MRRHTVREKVVQALYAHEISGDPVEHIIAQNLQGLDGDARGKAFAQRLVTETVRYADDIDELVKQHVDNWDFKRIAILDRVILRMAICEMTHFTDIPPKVSVNEAIELAKLFSTEKSGKFVNGVLDAVLAGMKKSGAMHKSGRGLYEGNSAPKKKPQRNKV